MAKHAKRPYEPAQLVKLMTDIGPPAEIAERPTAAEEQGKDEIDRAIWRVTALTTGRHLS
jgi:hypothetical protein